MPKHPMRKGVDLSLAPHVYLALSGDFKGETGTREHLVAVASTAVPGIEARWWLEKVVEVRESEGCTYGPVFGTPDGTLISSFEMNALLRHYLMLVQREDTMLIAADDDIIKNYSFERTFRNTAEGRARAAGLGELIDNTII